MFKTDSRFLVVDDSQTSRELIRTALSQLNLKTLDEAPNGRIGFEKIKKSIEENRPYSLVFCDYNMPEVDGLELLDMLRNQLNTDKVPVVMITTEGGKPVVIKAVMSGVSGYMVKPFGVDDVKRKVQEIFQRMQLQHESAGH